MSKEMVGGCCVCSDERGWQENPLVYCDGRDCTVAVHQACYGIVSVPAGPWFCEKCLSQEKTGKVKCELCPMREGAVKHTDNGGWAHVVCALYIPEVRFGNVTTMDPIILSGVPADRFSRICYICEERGLMEMKSEGACMQCNKLGCKAAFHVTCAQQEGLLCEESGQMDNIKYCGYCSHHFKKIKKDSNIKVVPPYKPVKLPKMTQNVNNTDNISALTPSVAAFNPNLAPSSNTNCQNVVRKPPNVNNNSGSNAGSPHDINHSPKNNPNGSFSPTKDPPNRIMSTKNPRSSPLNGGCPIKSTPKPLENHNTTPSPVPNYGCGANNGPIPTSANSASNDAHLMNSIVSVASCSSSGAVATTTTTTQRPLNSTGSSCSNVTPTAISVAGAIVGHHSPSASTAALTNGPIINPMAAIVPLTRIQNSNHGVAASELMPPPGQQRHQSIKTALHDSEAISPPISSTTPGVVSANNVGASASSTSLPNKKRANHNNNNNADTTVKSSSSSSIVAPGGATAAPVAKKPRRSSNKNIAQLLNQVSSVVEDTVSSFQREKVAANQQLMQQKLEQQQKLDGFYGSVGAIMPTSMPAGGGAALSSSMTGSSHSNMNNSMMSSLAAIASSSTANVDKKHSPSQHTDTIMDLATFPSTATIFKPSARNFSSDPHSSSFPTSLEQLLERQWEQGSQFLMEQAQHFDIASLLSCLQQLKGENQRLEDHIVNMISRRDHLLAVNARLSLLLNPQQQQQQPQLQQTSAAHQSPHSPRVHQSNQAVLLQQAASTSHDFQLESLVNANNALSRIAAIAVSNNVTPSASKSLQSMTSSSSGGPATVMVSPPIIPARSASNSSVNVAGGGGAGGGCVTNAIVGGGAFNTVVNQTAAAAAYASLLCGPQGKGPPSTTQHKPDQNPATQSIASTLNLTSHHQSQQQQQPPSQQSQQQAAAAAAAFVLPQLHTAAANQLAEHLVRSQTPLLPHQFALSQDPHHQQMLFQIMQQQVAYNNVLSGLIQQPTTSPHHHPALTAGGQQQQPLSNPGGGQSSMPLQAVTALNSNAPGKNC